MSPESNSWPVLSLVERRVLGVLVEKQKTTDTYPLSLNSVVTGSNQKSNRDPLLDLKDDEVEEGLLSAQKKGLVVQIVSGRVDKWRHKLYEAWSVSSVEIAVLAELLLRGPQTEGELRARAARMEEIRDLDQLRGILKPLAERKLVVYLTPEGRRGTILTHGFHDAQELEHLRGVAARSVSADESITPATAHSPPPAANLGPLEAKLASAQSEIAAVRLTVTNLQQEVARLTQVVLHIQKELGVTPPT
jgi:uncharacterized protein YceH (UPF0502 family)